MDFLKNSLFLFSVLCLLIAPVFFVLLFSEVIHVTVLQVFDFLVFKLYLLCAVTTIGWMISEQKQ